MFWGLPTPCVPEVCLELLCPVCWLLLSLTEPALALRVGSQASQTYYCAIRKSDTDLSWDRDYGTSRDRPMQSIAVSFQKLLRVKTSFHVTHSKCALLFTVHRAGYSDSSSLSQAVPVLSLWSSVTSLTVVSPSQQPPTNF